MAIGKITPQEEREMWRFLLQNTENFGTTGLWKQYKLVTGSARPIQTLYTRFKYGMSPKLHTMEFSVAEKARLYKNYKIEVDASFRDTLTEHGYRIDEQGFVVDEAEPTAEPTAEPVAEPASVAPKKPKKRRSSSIWTTSRKKPRTRKSAGSEAAPPAPVAPVAPVAPPAPRARKPREAPPPRSPRPVRGAVQPAPVEAPPTRRASRARRSASIVVKPEPVEVVEQVVEPEPIIIEDVKPRVTRARAAPAHIDSDAPVVIEPAPVAPAVVRDDRRAMFQRRMERRRTEAMNQMSVVKILKTLEPIAESAHKVRIEIALKQLQKKDQKVSTENVRSVIDSALKILNV